MRQRFLFATLLGTATGAALAQPTVSLGGKIDMGYGRYIGEDRAGLRDAAGSRLNLRGQEELGGGWRAQFALEHRFDPKTGQPTNPAVFWQGYSTAGLGHRQWGTLNLGRQYTAAYAMVQNVIDPWGGDTVAQLRSAWRGGISRTRVADAVRYDLAWGSARLAVSTGDSEAQGGANGGPDRPFSIGANAKIGPVLLAIGWEDPAHADDHLFNVGGTYQRGPVTLALGWARGVTARDDDFRSTLVALTYRQGAGEVKAGFVTGRTHQPDGTPTSTTRKLGVGYFHHLSRRTVLYANLARDSRATTHRVGYDLGMQHNF